MKKIVHFLFAILFFLSAQGYGDELIEFSIQDLNPAALESLRKGDLEGILGLEAGDKIPFMLSMEGDVVSLSHETPPVFNLQVNRKVYMKFYKGSFLFSCDKTTWSSFNDHFKGMLDVEYGEGNVGPVKISLKNIKKGKFDGVMELDEGATVPLALALKGNLFSFSDTVPLVHVEVSKKLYIQMLKDDVLFSLDKVTWKSAQEQFKGMLNIAFAQEEFGLLGSLSVK